jgi:hydroxymethylpyrimidine/phosphomethylpyrimidine kinase
MKKALTIAGSDSGGGAGIQADLKTFSAFGVYGMSVITSVTAQNTLGVDGIFDLPAEFVELQLNSVLRDIGTDAVKTGMLSNSSIVETVAVRLGDKELKKSVIDPVMISKSNHFLMQPEAREVLKEKLVPRAFVITPNIPEAQLIAGVEIHDEDGMRKAAKIIHKMGATNVVVKGGHLGGMAVDIFYDGKSYHRLAQERIPSKHTHGSGCTFASAIASCLALGMELGSAVERAKEFVTKAIAHGLAIGQGAGPTNHLFEKEMQDETRLLQEQLIQALEKLKRAGIGHLVPEVRSNFVAALSRAAGTDDVLGFPARIIAMGDELVTIAPPSPGGSRHMARVVLAAMQADPSVKSGMNLAYSEELVRASREAGLSVVELDRRKEPRKVREEEGASLDWGVRRVVKQFGGVPDIIFDTGAVGKEAMVRVLGKDPDDVARKVLAALSAGRKKPSRN